MLTESVQQPPVINWMDYGVWEYRLVVYPGKEVEEKIGQEKKSFTNYYKEAVAASERAHLTLAAFLGKEHMEATLIRWLHNICRVHPQFQATFHNFSGFVPHTIYLQVQNKQPFRQLAKSFRAIDHFIQANECPPLRLISTPHIAVAQRLSEETYFRALPTYQQRTFQQSFLVREVTLIKRASSLATCETVMVFPLAPEPLHSFN